MAFQPAGQTAATVTRYTGRLLPHLLTLTPVRRRFFSSLYPCPHKHLFFNSAVPLAARTFLRRPKPAATGSTTAKFSMNYAKIVNFADII